MRPLSNEGRRDHLAAGLPPTKFEIPSSNLGSTVNIKEHLARSYRLWVAIKSLLLASNCNISQASQLIDHTKEFMVRGIIIGAAASAVAAIIYIVQRERMKNKQVLRTLKQYNSFPSHM